jgi:hypothetical protein
MPESSNPEMTVRALAFLIVAAASLGAVLLAAPTAPAAAQAGKKPRGKRRRAVSRK